MAWIGVLIAQHRCGRGRRQAHRLEHRNAARAGARGLACAAAMAAGVLAADGVALHELGDAARLRQDATAPRSTRSSRCFNRLVLAELVATLRERGPGPARRRSRRRERRFGYLLQLRPIAARR